MPLAVRGDGVVEQAPEQCGLREVVARLLRLRTNLLLVRLDDLRNAAGVKEGREAVPPAEPLQARRKRGGGGRTRVDVQAGGPAGATPPRGARSGPSSAGAGGASAGARPARSRGAPARRLLAGASSEAEGRARSGRSARVRARARSASRSLA